MVVKFIVLDGPDAAGKSLMVQKLGLYLEKKLGKKNVFLTAEPSKSAFGKKLREMLIKETNPKENAQKFLDLYVLDRKEHLEKEILPALKKGKLVLCDRYKYSTIVYQSVQGIEVKKIIELHKGMLVPDLVLILEVEPKTALERIAKSSRSGFDVFEKKDFLEKVRQSFLELPVLLPEEKIKLIDANREAGNVFTDLKKEVDKILT